MTAKYLIPLCATVALLAGCNNRDNPPPEQSPGTTSTPDDAPAPGTGDTPTNPGGTAGDASATPPDSTVTPPPAETTPPGETPPTTPPQ